MALNRNLVTLYLAASAMVTTPATAEPQGFRHPVLEGIRAFCINPDTVRDLKDKRKLVRDLCAANKELFELMYPDGNYSAPSALQDFKDSSSQGFRNKALEEMRALCVDPKPSQKLKEIEKTVPDACRANKKLFEEMYPQKNYYGLPPGIMM